MFSKPCLVNLISKDTHLVFSIFCITEEDDSAVIEEPKKMLIIDCRSYGAAFANRAKGGGVECPGE